MLSAPVLARGSAGGNCVAYVRDVTGIHVSGNAGTWWSHAEGRYRRGHEPTVGAVLVFKPYGRMHSGHVAAVSRVVGKREILVDHANWVRGRITKAMDVVDVSPANDWTIVKVRAQAGARDNPTFGFIYPERGEAPAHIVLVSHAGGGAKENDRAEAHRHRRQADDERHAARHHRHHDRDGATRVTSFES